MQLEPYHCNMRLRYHRARCHVAIATRFCCKRSVPEAFDIQMDLGCCHRYAVHNDSVTTLLPLV